MARIRTVKPEFWTDETVGECSVSARLLFVASWNFADDYGGLERSSKQLKAQAFPYDNFDCEALVQELLEHGLLIEYEVAGKKYLHIKGFRKHQKVEKPAKPRIPVYEESMRTTRLLPDSSPTPPRLVAVSSLESKGRESKGSNPPLPPFDELKVDGLDQAAWQDWVTYRAKRKPAIKPESRRKAAERMAALGDGQRAAVDHSIANGYQGLIPPKDNGNGRRDDALRLGKFEVAHKRLRDLAAAAESREVLGGDARVVRNSVDRELRPDAIGAMDFCDHESDITGTENVASAVDDQRKRAPADIASIPGIGARRFGEKD